MLKLQRTRDGWYETRLGGTRVEVIRLKGARGGTVWTAWLSGECVSEERTLAEATRQATLSAWCRNLCTSSGGAL